MRQTIFYRNVRARDHLEIFLLSSITSLLLIRFFLRLTGYPQVGGGQLHIAHMLYGGLLMAAAIMLMISFIGARVQRLAAFIGGLGFGIFIDELGKFLTKDNNYFFRPTIGLIYAVFIALYLVTNFLGRDERLTKREYELNALTQFEEAVVHDMDELERARIRKLLTRADKGSPVTLGLTKLLSQVELVPTPEPLFIKRFLSHASRSYQRFWSRRSSDHIIGTLFVAEAFLFLFAVFATIYGNFDSISDFLKLDESYGKRLIIGQLISSLIASGFAVAGAIKLTSSRVEALEQFRRATLVNLFLTEFFIFSRIQLAALPGFLVNLILLLAIRYSLYQEQRSRLRSS
jgi:hypothetical protein